MYTFNLYNSFHQLYTMRYELRPVRVTEEKLHGSKKPGVKIPFQVLSTILYRTKNFLPGRKEWPLKLITFSSQPIPVSGLSQEFFAPVVES